MNIFSERLKEVRLSENLTQKLMAEKLGISTTCYAGYEQGYRQPDINMLKKICVIF